MAQRISSTTYPIGWGWVWCWIGEPRAHHCFPWTMAAEPKTTAKGTTAAWKQNSKTNEREQKKRLGMFHVKISLCTKTCNPRLPVPPHKLDFACPKFKRQLTTARIQAVDVASQSVGDRWRLCWGVIWSGLTQRSRRGGGVHPTILANIRSLYGWPFFGHSHMVG